MLRRDSEAFAAVRNCVAREKVRCLHDEAGVPHYFTTAKGRTLLANVGVDSHLAKHPVDDDGRLYGAHVYKIAMEGKQGLLKRFGTIERVSAAFAGTQEVPFTKEVIAETVIDREALAQRIMKAQRDRDARSKSSSGRG